MTISILGLTNDDKVPGFYGETLYGQGAVSLGALPVFCLVTGNKLTAGTATADQDVVDILSAEDAETFFGAKAEISQQCYAALEIPGVTLKAAPVAEAGGAVAATLTITVGGAASPTEAGELSVWVKGKLFNIGIATTDTQNSIATALGAELNKGARDPWVASVATNVVTLTIQSKGTRGNDYIAFKDDSKGKGITLALGGAGSSVAGGGKKFGGGTGTDDVTNVINILKSATYHYIAQASNDATNAALLRDHVNTESGPLIGHLEHYVFARHGTLSDAISLAQTTLNAQRGQVIWHTESETHPSEIAAQAAALRSVTEGDNPNPNYDDVLLPTVVGSRVKSNIPQHSTLKSALNSGVSPLTTMSTGKVQIVKFCTTKSLNGTAPDYRTHEVGEAVVPDRIRTDLSVIWLGEFKPSNPYAGPNTSVNERNANSGIATPQLWQARVYQYLKEVAEPSNWIMDVDTHLPIAEWNTSAKRVMSAVPHVVRPLNHQVGVSVRQQAA